MKRIIKLSLCIFSLSIITLFLVSCSQNKVDSKKKNIIQLSIDNYEKYFDVSFSIRSSVKNTVITFSGCVYGGIYENCVVTYIYATSSGEELSKSDSFELNLGGNGSKESLGYNQQISNVTGTVTYWN